MRPDFGFERARAVCAVFVALALWHFCMAAECNSEIARRS